MPIYALGDLEPTIADDAYVHPDAVVIGDVRIGSGSSIWPGAVLRGDTGVIHVGERTSIQDGTVVHTTHENRFAFNELQQLRDQANHLDVEWGQLLLEQSTFGVDGRIEQKAVDQLQMQVPEIDDIVMVRHD